MRGKMVTKYDVFYSEKGKDRNGKKLNSISMNKSKKDHKLRKGAGQVSFMNLSTTRTTAMTWCWQQSSRKSTCSKRKCNRHQIVWNIEFWSTRCKFDKIYTLSRKILTKITNCVNYINQSSYFSSSTFL